jgi:hypothetical protein
VKGTKIVIEAVTPLVFSTDAERQGYTESITRIVQAHGAHDVTVQTGEETEFLSGWGVEATEAS